MATDSASAALRGCAVGALSALVTVAAHRMGGAMLPSESALVVLVLACAGVGWLSAGLRVGRRALTQLMLTLAGAQVLGHLLLTIIDGHHHGALIDSRMATAHAAAVVVGGYLISAAELGVTRALAALRQILPMVDAVLVVESDLELPIRHEDDAHVPRLVDLSGCGTRGPPALV